MNQAGPAKTSDRLPEYYVSRQRCMYCKKDDKDIKPFVKFSTCGVYVCLVKERNFFLKCHTFV